MGGLNHTYFTYDRAYGRLRPFIILRVLRKIMAFAVLGVLSVVLRAVWGPFGPLFPPLGGLPGALGGFQSAPGGLLRALLGLFGAIWTSQADTLSLYGALSRVQEALGGILGPLQGLLGVILTFGKEPPSSKHMIARYLSSCL